MRNGYYDYNAVEEGNSRVESSKWKLEERPEPYGQVSRNVITPEQWEKLPVVDFLTPEQQEELQKQDIQQPDRQGKSRRYQPRRVRDDGARGFRGFAIFMVFLVLALGAGIYFQIIRVEPLHWGDLWEQLNPSAWGQLWQERNAGESDWQRELPKTRIPLAALNPNVCLNLEPVGETALTPGEIYQRTNPAVVEVQAYTGQECHVGSGVVMTEDGYIITNAHIIAGASRAVVVLADGSRGEASLVGYDGGTDLAVLKLDASGLVAASFGNSADLKVGDSAYAIGNPTGTELRGTMTDGMISAIDRNIYTGEGQMTLIQHTAPINSGSSGGALVNQYGQVVGITNMKMMSSQETYEGLGFAIPTSMVKQVVNQLLSTGEFAGEPMLGIIAYAVTAQDGRPAGVQVDSVLENSDAWAKGIRPGDIIVSANGVAVANVEDLQRVRDAVGLGGTLCLEVWNYSAGEVRNVEVVLQGARGMK